MTVMLMAGALGVAVLAPGGAAAQTRPPRDPNPPAYDRQYDHRDDHGCYHDGYHDGYDRQGQWHHGHSDRQGGRHDGPHGRQR